MQNYHVIIPAAGKGTRMKRDYNKLFIELAGRPILAYTLAVFQNDVQCQGIHLAVHPRDYMEMRALCQKFNKVRTLIEGGATRQDSIHRVLQAVSLEDNDLVLVHDGARPFVSHETIHRLCEAVQQQGAAIVGVKAKDTIKEVQHHTVTKTLDRSVLWQIQTPQGATYKTLLNAYQQAEQTQFEGTDDASLLEHAGETVHVVEGDYENIKITTEDDLWMGQAFLNKRSSDNHV
ncbi:2-C-methyl-D-erythritol 4-phosphate cytidylyltransferase [Staphylococcus chromogenes]|uniref:2-C-methyl-D-erythritol 4-phosphate cytidylyltransferase n=1 Tax=Staphylococcus chromogenes TaxID=46126 RepID=UPI0021CFE9C5|nr:2-C-methyl-D-erythritol 4-phosphate cytidylyltransferase [Staphylococcus chromogenes]UXS75374.1 2-C-methyl-D-erythritol 4-phosphate cytidylyltransferase [Staphylococcus chromogenes]